MLTGLGLTIALSRGADVRLHELAVTLREHVTARLAVETTGLLLSVTTASRLSLMCLALGLDGAVGIGEAWLLHRGQRWAIWVVVAAMAALIPWELVELRHGVHLLRACLLALNVVVVLYLTRQAWKHR